MINLFNKIRKNVRSAVAAVKTIIICKSAEGYVDTGVKILIAVVLGALLLAGLYTLFNSTIMPTVTQRITSLFNYTGA